MSTNAGFRPEELNRRQFQRVAATALDKQAEAIGAGRGFMADLATRLDNLERRVDTLERRQRSFEHMPVLARLWWVVTGR